MSTDTNRADLFLETHRKKPETCHTKSGFICLYALCDSGRFASHPSGALACVQTARLPFCLGAFVVQSFPVWFRL